jgi:hypothetical protein
VCSGRGDCNDGRGGGGECTCDNGAHGIDCNDPYVDVKPNICSFLLF